jgi:hypothetical protein
MKAAIISAFALVLISGCATYVEGGFGVGFNDTPLARDTYRIQSYGETFTTRQTTNAIALVRAAELTANNGYDRFIVLDYDEWTKSEYYTTPATVSTNTNVSGQANTYAAAYCSSSASVYGLGSNAFGNASTRCNGTSNTQIDASAASTTTFRPAQTYEMQKPRTDMVVRFVSVDSPERDSALLVRDVIRRFGKTAGIKPEQAEFIVQQVGTGPAYYSAPAASVVPMAAVTPYSVPVSSAAPRRERSINEVYASLTPQERSRVAEMPFAEQIDYLRARQ